LSNLITEQSLHDLLSQQRVPANAVSADGRGGDLQASGLEWHSYERKKAAWIKPSIQKGYTVSEALFEHSGARQ
jgi:hypothetical protein